MPSLIPKILPVIIILLTGVFLSPAWPAELPAGSDIDCAPNSKCATNIKSRREDNPYILAAKHTRKDVASLYDKAVELIRNQNWQEAIKALHALRRSPFMDNWQNRSGLLLGYAYIQIGKDEKALETLPGSIGVFNSIRSELNYLLADTYFRVGDYKSARRYFRMFIRYHDDFPERHGELWGENELLFLSQIKELQCLIHLRRFKSAIGRSIQYEKRYEERTESDHPLLADLQWIRSLAYRNLGKTRNEALVLQKLSLDGNGCRFACNATARMDELRTQGITFEPEDAEKLLNHVARLRTSWSHERALELIEHWESQHDHSVHDEKEMENCQKVHYQKGRMLFYLSRYEEALAIFKSLYKDKSIKESIRIDALSQMARTLGRMNRLEEASEKYLELVKEFPDDPNIANSRFMAGWLLGSKPELFATTDRLLADFLENHPRNGLTLKAMWFRGWFAYRAEKLDLAKRYFIELRDRYPWHDYAAACRYWIGRILEKQGEPEKAKSYYVFLAGEDRYRYYRLLAINRLQKLLVVKDSHPLPDEFNPVFEDPLSHKQVEDKVVNENYDTRYTIWNTWRKEAETIPPFSLIQLREGIQSSNEKRQSLTAKGFDKRSAKLIALSKSWKSIFPEFNKALIFNRLGMEKESARSLGFLIDHMARTKKKLPDLPILKEFDNGEILRKEREESFEEENDELLTSLFAAASQWKMTAHATRIFSFLMSKKQRGKLPYDIGLTLWYPVPYADAISSASEKFDVPDDLIVSIMRKESYFNPDAISSANAIGLMQVMPHTGERISLQINDEGFDPVRLLEPAVGIEYGAWYLGQLLIKFDRQLPLAIAAYNGGPHNVAIWLERNPNLEWDEFIESIEFGQTRLYVKKVLQYIAAYRDLYAGSLSSWDFSKPIDYSYGDNINW